MDGFALRRSDLVGAAPWRLPILGRIAAGEDIPLMFRDGGAVRILRERRFQMAATRWSCRRESSLETVSLGLSQIFLVNRLLTTAGEIPLPK
jgi:hypothetical protein